MTNATLIEVAPRDGFQPIGPFIPTADKVAFVRAAHAAGLHRIEIGSVANPNAVPVPLRNDLSPRQLDVLVAGGVINWLRERIAA